MLHGYSVYQKLPKFSKQHPQGLYCSTFDTNLHKALESIYHCGNLADLVSSLTSEEGELCITAELPFVQTKNVRGDIGFVRVMLALTHGWDAAEKRRAF